MCSLYVERKFQLPTDHSRSVINPTRNTIHFCGGAVVNKLFTFRRAAAVHLVDRERNRHALVFDDQNALELERVAVSSTRDSFALEFNVGKLLRVEKIRGPQMRVAALVPRIDTVCLDRCRDG